MAAAGPSAGPTPLGLNNLGLTCYMNAAIQCFASIFADYFKGRFMGDLADPADLKDTMLIPGADQGKVAALMKLQGPLTDKQIYAEFAKNFGYLMNCVNNTDSKWTKPESDILIRRFNALFRLFKKSTGYVPNTPNDSDEFFKGLREILSTVLSFGVKMTVSINTVPVSDDELKDVFNDDRTGVMAKLNPFDSAKLRAIQEFREGCLVPTKDGKRRRSSCISEQLCGQKYTAKICSKCKYQSASFNISCELQLHIGDNNNLVGCLSQYFTTETLEGFICSKCKAVGTTEKSDTLWRTPDWLVVQFVRFSATQKITTNVSYPVEGLDMAPYVVFKNQLGEVFDLEAVVLHTGSIQNGHYTCIRKINGGWWKFDDSNVEPVSAGSAVSENAYFMVYRRRPTPQSK